MRTKCTFFCLFFFSLFGQSQLQFVAPFSISPTDGGSVFGIRSTGLIKVLHNFIVTDPKSSSPFSIIEGPDGRIYGVTDQGGANHKGVVYAMNADGSAFTILYTCPASGAITNTTPAFGPDGKLYVIISGMLSSMNPDGSLFASIAALPNSPNLQIDANSWVYGIGKSGSQNFIYKIKTDGTGYTAMHTLIAATEGNGISAGLCLTPTGRLFATNSTGGANGVGTLYSIRTDGTDFTVHKIFSTAPSEGRTPQGIPMYKDGKIWGTTLFGGNLGNGVIYSFDTATLAYSVIFESSKGLNTGLTAGLNGKIYGVTASNPAYIFRIDPDGLNYEEIYSVLPSGMGQPGSNHEVLYLTTNNHIVAGANNGLYSSNCIVGMDNDGQNAALLHNFGYAPDGNNPGGLVKDGANKLYGVTLSGGAEGGGLIYKMNYDGTGYTVLHDFTGSQGVSPAGKLLLASDGKLYGLCIGQQIGISGGVVFRINTDGSNYEMIRQLPPTELQITQTQGNLLEGSGGQLFGLVNSATSGGAAVFRVNKDGTGYMVLRHFSPLEGSNPQDGLIESGGYLYGACSFGGSSNNGTVFRIRPDGTGFQVVFALNSNPGNTLGVGPLAGLTDGKNGRLYGVNSFGGANSAGTIYSFIPGVTITGLTILHSFDFATTGFIVPARLILGSDGKLYGTTISGGTTNNGTFFRINTDGTGYTVLKNFDGTAGRLTWDELLEIPLLPLPVSLTDFVAQEKGSKVELSWITAQEENSDSFVVERSNDGTTDFSPVATIGAKGFSSVMTTYAAEDIHPIRGKNYYRLKMLDRDGQFKYSQIRLVEFEKGNDLISFYPNPAKNEITIESNFRGNKLNIAVTDISGRLISKQTIANASIILYNISALQVGVYTLTIGDGSSTTSYLLIKK